MKVETAVVEVDGAHHGHLIVTQTAFCMNEPRGIFVDLHSRLHQAPVVGTGDGKDERLVRDARRDNPHIHPSLRRQPEGPLHIVVDDQIRRVNIDIMTGLVQDIDVSVFPGLFVVQRAVGERLDHAVRRERFRMPHVGPVHAEVGVVFREGIPHGQEHHGQVPDPFPFQPDTGIFPVAEPDDAVHVLVRHIGSSRVAHPAVNNGNLPVVPVVIDQGEEGLHGVECHDPDAVRLQIPLNVPGDVMDAADVIVDQTDIHAGSGLFLQNGAYPGTWYPPPDSSGRWCDPRPGIRPSG